VKAKEIMKLTESAEIVTWPETHYVFLEKTGPIPKNAPLAWQEFLPFVPAIESHYHRHGLSEGIHGSIGVPAAG
jgi:hypothetical protein